MQSQNTLISLPLWLGMVEMITTKQMINVIKAWLLLIINNYLFLDRHNYVLRWLLLTPLVLKQE